LNPAAPKANKLNNSDISQFLEVGIDEETADVDSSQETSSEDFESDQEASETEREVINHSRLFGFLILVTLVLCRPARAQFLFLGILYYKKLF